jgi:hypothetical protein
MTRSRHRSLFVLSLTTAAALSIAVASFSQAPTGSHDMSSMPGMAMPPANGSSAGAAEPDAAGAADGAMSHEHMGMGPHMKFTALRAHVEGDDRRAAVIVDTLRTAIDKYRDYKVAVADHFIEFAPNIKQPMYHFTNYRYAAAAQREFDPAKPTSLLYKPTAGGGFELVGAMYTAPKSFTDEQLDQRVPLSVAAWHEHVNICLPPKTAYATTDWDKFGFHGSIATESECSTSAGIFHPLIFGWMVHAYPFAKDPAKIWAH